MQVNRYLGIFIFVFGIIGNTLNVLVLSQRPLCLNPCAWLFLIASIANSIGILAGLISRFLSTWALDLTNTNQFLCKIRAFLLFDGITIGSWLIALATIDRWLSSNINVIRRQQSTLKNAQRSTILVVIVSTIIQTQQLYCFEANLTNTPLKCYTQTIVCGIISDVCFALVTILFPIIVMFIFGLMTISNVRKTQSRLQPETLTMNARNGHESTITNMRNPLQRKKSDRHLLIMLFIQVLLILLFTLPLSAYKLYSTLTRNVLKSTLQNTIENFMFNIFLLALYVSCGMPFYIYTLSGGRVFRKALFSLMEALRRKMMHILHQ
ncbi:unnamed protein product [Adineta steineri]|uniref:G-protein coupled receptors family 1 profile domain-containing protein n=3 Tax=Adineta steineri TaxID=433720 RepID=A0A813RW56_9BILA|nr:unnamed protein product [Adineta steineri]CAF0790944.1 unnamed protein product [Adineta steineri]CAF0893099.1 unnamed protein product [Adineta steineri]